VTDGAFCRPEPSANTVDILARDYVALALRAEKLLPGLVDAQSGTRRSGHPAASEPPRGPAELAGHASRLRARAGELANRPTEAEPLSGRRLDQIDRQLVALEYALRRLAGEPTNYRAELLAYFDTEVELGVRDQYHAAHAALAEILPGRGSLAERMAAYRAAERVPPPRIGRAVTALSTALRHVTSTFLALPDGEAVHYEVATDRPWGGFNRYLGELRSLVVVNGDVTNQGAALAQLVAHEAYPGHHTEQCRAVTGPPGAQRYPERGLYLTNTPQSLISEGMADLALRALLGPGWGRWVESVLAEVGVRMDGELAEWVELASRVLRPVRQDAALLLHSLDTDPEQVRAYLRRWLLVDEPRARHILRFLRHPRWRAYTTSYVEGARLVQAWLAAPAGGAGDALDPSVAMPRLLRLMDEPWTPSQLRAAAGSPSTQRSAS
jgi:hypothetical protein